MADFYEQFTITPASIPAGLISNELWNELQEAGISIDELPPADEDQEECVYLYGEYTFDQETLPPLLQRLVQESQGEIDRLVVEGALLCGKMYPESHGGFAMVITSTEIHQCWTAVWIQNILQELEGKALPADEQTFKASLTDDELLAAAELEEDGYAEE